MTTLGHRWGAALAIAFACAPAAGCRDVAGLSGLTFRDGQGAGGGAGGDGGGGEGAAGASGAMGGGGAAVEDCSVFAPADGGNLLILSVALSPTSPVLFYATFSGPDAVPPYVDLVAIDAGDHSTPVGEAQRYTVDYSEGFEVVAEGLVIPGAANALNGFDSTVSLTLHGLTCYDSSICGTISGMILTPVELDLVGSTFVLLSGLENPEPYPINCNGDLATP